MASVQEYVKKLSTEQLLFVLAEHEKSDDPWSQLVVQSVLAVLADREKKSGNHTG